MNGQVIAHYKIIELLGFGGMGEVPAIEGNYQVRQQTFLNRRGGATTSSAQIRHGVIKNCFCRCTDNCKMADRDCFTVGGDVPGRRKTQYCADSFR